MWKCVKAIFDIAIEFQKDINQSIMKAAAAVSIEIQNSKCLRINWKQSQF